MKNFLVFLLRSMLAIIPKRMLNVLLEQSFAAGNINPLTFAYNRIGILLDLKKSENGELIFLKEILTKHFQERNRSEFVFFDVGANKGEYTELLLKVFPNAIVYCFEPLPKAFEILQKKFVTDKNITVENLALGKHKTITSIHTYQDDHLSGHSTFSPEILEKVHGSVDNVSFRIHVDTIAEYCSNNSVDRIDFLKIDVEGNEYEVLIGAKELIDSNRIDVIQFEFNEMNVFSRVFLHDFYRILPNYNFLRICPEGLISMNEYSTNNEIFKFQNIVAFRK